MNIPRRGVLALSTVALLTLSGLQPASAVGTEGPTTGGSQVSGPVADELTNLVRFAIEDRNTAVLAAKAPAARLPEERSTSAYKATRAREVPELAARKARFKNFGFAYFRADSALTLESLVVSDSEATVNFVEKTELYLTSDGGGPSDVPTEYSVAQTARFKATPSGWQLDGLSLVDYQPGGLPMTIIDPVGLLAPAGPPTNPASNRAMPGQSGASKTPKVLSTGPAESPTTMAGYDYNAMINYAMTYWDNYNPNYRTFDGVGGDCTNFISQAMYAGGWGQVTGWYQSDQAWWYNSVNQTWTWINAQKFANFASSSGRIFYLNYLNDMGPADILQVNWSGAGDVQHTMIVTYFRYTGGKNDIRVTYHSKDTPNRSIWDLYSSYPGAWWYALRT